MRRTLVVVLLALMVLTLVATACAKKTPAPAAPEQKKWKVGWSTDNIADPWKRHQMECGRRALLRHPEIEVFVTEAQGQATKQISDIEDLIARGVDLIMVSPRDEKSLQAVLAKAYQKGIKVVLVDRMVEGDQWTAAIRSDNVAIGRKVGQFVGEKLGGRGGVVQIEGLPGTTTAIERKKGFEEELKKYPGIKLLASQPGNYSKADSTAVMENFIQGFGKQIKAVYAPSANMAFGALIALENAGIDPSTVLICSVDGEMAEIKAVMDGKFACCHQYSNAADVAAEVSWRLLNGQKVPEVLEMTGAFITKDMAAQYYKEGAFSLDDVLWEPGKWTLEQLISKSKTYTKSEWLAVRGK